MGATSVPHFPGLVVLMQVGLEEPLPIGWFLKAAAWQTAVEGWVSETVLNGAPRPSPPGHHVPKHPMPSKPMGPIQVYPWWARTGRAHQQARFSPRHTIGTTAQCPLLTKPPARTPQPALIWPCLHGQNPIQRPRHCGGRRWAGSRPVPGRGGGTPPGRWAAGPWVRQREGVSA